MGAVDNPPAFPLGVPHMTEYQPEWGMSLRDWFAGQALVGLLSGQFRHSGGHNFHGLPKEAFDVADAMLSARQSSGAA